MFPEDFISRISNQKYIDHVALLAALEEPSPVSIRVNPSKWNRKPLNSEPVPWAGNGFYLDTRPSYTLDPIFHSGCYYPQEASGMFLEQVIRQTADASEPLHILDLCGAPGGKSTLLADMAGVKSFVVANDVIKNRAQILAETITKWGSGNVVVTRSDPSSFGRLKGYFDVILADAPCSGEGMFRTDVARNEWSYSNTVHCAERQQRILLDIWPALKENGILIYSTCTFNPGENEENIKWLTGRQKAESVILDISGFGGITAIDYQGISGYGFYPDRVKGEGFFISVVRKTERQESLNVKNQKINEFRPAGKDIEIAGKWTGFSADRILKWGDDLWAVPCNMDDYLLLFQNLRIVMAGTRICTVKKSDYLPSHDISLSQHLKNDAFPSAEISYNDAIAFMRRDNLGIKIDSKGWNVVTYSGVRLGYVNNLGNRLNNYFPVEWRIRMNKPSEDASLIKWA